MCVSCVMDILPGRSIYVVHALRSFKDARKPIKIIFCRGQTNFCGSYKFPFLPWNKNFVTS